MSAHLAVTAGAATLFPGVPVHRVDDLTADPPADVEVLVTVGDEVVDTRGALRRWRRAGVEVVAIDPTRGPTLGRGPHAATVELGAADALLPAVDPLVANPVLWRRRAKVPHGTLLHRPTPAAAAAAAALGDVDADDWHLLVPDDLTGAARREVLGERRAATVRDTADLVDRAKRVRVLLQDPAWDADARRALAGVVAALAAGTPVVTTADHPAARAGLPVVVAEDPRDLRAAAAHLVDDEDERERVSVAARRTVLQQHTGAARLAALRARLGLVDRGHVPRVSVLLATNRPEHVAHAVRSVATQDHPDVELVLLLHGDAPQPPAELDRFPGPVQVVRVPQERVLGEVLNAGLDVATGDLVAKMDDDDLYGRHHLGDLVLALGYSGADLVGRRIEHVYLRGRDVTVTRARSNVERDRDHVSGPTLLLPTDVARRYRFLPLPRRVDSTLLERLREDDRRVYGTHALDVVLHRHGAHTWDADEDAWLEDAELVTDGLDLARTASTPDSYRAVWDT
ncbi:glycosyltransferase [Nitriliruptoraceae bacterium ZYF776]|nr:glycosyltransferase [Profundirhabdus halotolerans]